MKRAIRVLVALRVAELATWLLDVARRMVPATAAPAAQEPAPAPPVTLFGVQFLVDRPLVPFHPQAITLGMALRQACRLPEARS